MSKLSLRRAIAACTLPAAVLAAPTVVFAEEAIEEVVVTGSFIRGTPQDAALPVDVVSQQDLTDIGNPTIAEMPMLQSVETRSVRWHSAHLQLVLV